MLCPHFDNLPLEYLQRLLDERVVLEIILVERHRGGRFFLGRGRGLGGAGRCGGSGRGRGGSWRWRNRGRGGNWSDTASRSVGPHKLDLYAGVAQFSQLGLKQRVVPRIVYETTMVVELGIKADGEQAFLERHRMRFEQIGADERARASGGIHELGPQGL